MTVGGDFSPGVLAATADMLGRPLTDEFTDDEVKLAQDFELLVGLARAWQLPPELLQSMIERQRRFAQQNQQRPSSKIFRDRLVADVTQNVLDRLRQGPLGPVDVQSQQIVDTSTHHILPRLHGLVTRYVAGAVLPSLQQLQRRADLRQAEPPARPVAGTDTRATS